MKDNSSLESIWDGLLSGDADKVVSVYKRLDKDSRRNVYIHLKRMAEENGWNRLQKVAAQAAIKFIDKLERE